MQQAQVAITIWACFLTGQFEWGRSNDEAHSSLPWALLFAFAALVRNGLGIHWLRLHGMLL